MELLSASQPLMFPSLNREFSKFSLNQRAMKDGKIEIIQGDPKKTIHSVLYLRSVVEVQFYFFTGVSELEFRARFTWSPY